MATGVIRKKHAINLVLLSFVVVLGLVLWLQPGQKIDVEKTLTEIDKSAVQHLKIEIADQPTLEIQKTELYWYLSKPIVVAANSFRVENILNMLNAVSYAQYDLAKSDLQQYGLQPALASLQVDAETIIYFGAVEPLSKRRYVQIDNTLHLVDDTHYPLISQGLGSVVSNRLTPINITLQQIQVKAFTVVRNSKQSWNISPADNTLNADAIQAWINLWRHTEAIYVEHKPLAAIDSSSSIRLQFDNGEYIQYAVINSDNETALYRSDLGLKYVLSAEIFARLTNKPEAQAEAADLEKVASQN